MARQAALSLLSVEHALYLKDTKALTLIKEISASYATIPFVP